MIRYSLNKNNISKKKALFLKKALDWFIEKRKLNRFDAKVKISFPKRNYDLNRECDGVVYPDEENDEYTIVIRHNMRYRESVEVLFHEFYHVYQYTSRQLRFERKEDYGFDVIYNGKNYGENHEVYLKYGSFNVPWERPAWMICLRDAEKYYEELDV